MSADLSSDGQDADFGPTTHASPHRQDGEARLDPAESGKGSSGTGALGLPTCVLGQAQRRLMVVSAVLAVFISLVVASHAALVFALGWAAPHCGMPLVGATGGALALLSIAVFALARSPRLAPRTVLDLGLAYEVVGAVGIALASFFNDPAALARQTNVWLCLWIVLFPLVAPGTPWKTILASILSASAGPLVVLAWARRLQDLPPAAQLVQAFLPYYLGVLLALLPRHVQARLGATVSRAQLKARELGSYRLVKLLGKGGMGEVWEAEHGRLARPAAIKLVNVDALESGDERSRKKTLQRFEYEARATASLRSPHTVTVYDFGVSDEGTFYYVMELLSGLDLETLVQRFGPLPPARVVHILKQVVDSLAEAHARGMVHRDVKPANIYLTRLGLEHDFAKVLDFGLVSHAKGCYRADESRLTAVNTIVGTPEYMSPEMAEGTAVDGRADLYALGAVAYWLLTGTQVFDAPGRTPMQVLADHMRSKPQMPSVRIGRALPEDLEILVLELLAKDPAERPASALEVKARLEALDLDESWSPDHARTWWTRNLRELAAPTPAASATTIVRAPAAASPAELTRPLVLLGRNAS